MGTLKKLGYKLNPYDKCVANKIINKKQCTIAWHVDDAIASHVDKRVLQELENQMKADFGEMDILEGSEHSVLGMNVIIDKSQKTVKIEMKDQMRKLIEKFEHDSGESVQTSVSTPSAHNLFKDRKYSEIFHSTMASLLYIMKRARPDIETGVSFLMRRVSKSTKDDWMKLKRILSFLNGTIEDERTIGADSLTEIFTWIDAAYAVHDKLRSHMGGLISLGTGVVHAKSSMKKINTKSSTEAELVGLAEYLPYNIWFLHFMRAQGYDVKNNTIYQDNKSAILMERNGRNFCNGNSRHINVRYFWVKDKIDQGEVKVAYLPTLLMVIDFFMKSLVGALLQKVRNYIMGWRPMSEPVVQIKDNEIKEDAESFRI